MDDDWPDSAVDSTGVDHQRLSIRLACSIAALLVLVALTWDFFDEAMQFLWPPTDPLAQWTTLVLLHAFGYVVVPLMIGSFVADRLFERFVE